MITQQILITLGPNLYHTSRCILGVFWLSSKIDDLDLFFEDIGVDFQWKFAIFACKHDNSTNISHIGPKLIPCMYLRSVLVKFEDGWPWPIFRGHGVDFNMKFFSCKHDNSINISRIDPKLIPWMYRDLKSVSVKFEDGWPWPIFLCLYMYPGMFMTSLVVPGNQ